MDEYELIKKSSLKFKGEKKKKKKRSERSRPDGRDESASSFGALDERLDDAESHGGWWEVTKVEHIQDAVAIELLPGTYAQALSNGRIVLGQPHPPGDGPDEEEIFTAIRAGVDRIALKSGFGRYLSVDSKNRLKGLSEAAGELETFVPVFEDGKLALCAYNDCFISPDANSNPPLIVARAERVDSNQVIKIRVNHDPLALEKQEKAGSSSSNDLGTIIEAEKILKRTKGISAEEEIKRLKKARLDGQLYEALLDTRVKQKSDKYCK